MFLADFYQVSKCDSQARFAEICQKSLSLPRQPHRDHTPPPHHPSTTTADPGPRPRGTRRARQATATLRWPPGECDSATQEHGTPRSPPPVRPGRSRSGVVSSGPRRRRLPLPGRERAARAMLVTPRPPDAAHRTVTPRGGAGGREPAFWWQSVSSLGDYGAARRVAGRWRAPRGGCGREDAAETRGSLHSVNERRCKTAAKT